MARITINGISWDPVAEAQVADADARGAAPATSSAYVLVQTDGPASAGQQQELAAAGAEIIEYVPDDTFLCRLVSGDLAAVQQLPFVIWVGDYLQGFKVSAALVPAEAGVAAAAPTETPRAASRKPVDVDVVLHDDVDADSPDLRERIAAATGRNADDLAVEGQKVRMAVREDQLADLAAIEEVRTVEPAPRRQLFNNVARTILDADVVGGSTPFEGAGQVVAVADTGFDRGSVSNVHPAFTGRVVRLYALGRPGRADDPDGHGTHVAGSVLGDGTSATMGGAVRGTAPRAQLVLQSLLSAGGALGGIPIDLRNLFRPPYDDDARVHTNSWGSVVPGRPYDSSSREIDDMVWNNPDLVILFAAGNDGVDANRNGVVDAGQIGAEAAAKNCITVGASESERPGFTRTYDDFPFNGRFPASPIRDDLQADDPRGMAAFSSRGPTREGRIKPDVVAPGSCILSTRSRALVMVSTTFGTSADPLLRFESGTSMATPLVAGCVAVLREALLAGGVAPSAALVKALLINGAVELPGQYSPSEAGRSPNISSGFGLVNLSASVAAAEGRQGTGFREAGPLQQGDEDEFSVEVPDDGSTLKVTLVWSDPPGAALQNDLDLIVRADGREQHGNVGETTRFDRVNNVEQVVWTGLPAGPVSVVVRGFRVTRPQPFACAWSIA
jgi:hypothetical protein